MKYKVGAVIYQRIRPPRKYEQKVSDSLLRLYGTKSYKEKLYCFWSKKYSLHIYTSLIVILLTVGESLSSQGIFFLGGNVCCHYYLDEKLKEEIETHRRALMNGFFEFSSLFTLMINAGLNYKNALEYSIGDHAFSPYLNEAIRQIKTGKSEILAFEEIPLQCRETVITRYFACIVQGQRHGNRSVRNDLKRITEENWNEKLKLHRKNGEVLKTKLLLPMMLIFIGILGILLMPVMIQFQQLM